MCIRDRRYLAAARTVSELAVSSRAPLTGSRVILLPVDRTQEDHVDGLPFGTRGGPVVTHTFPYDGEYEIQARLQRNRNENVEGLEEPHEVEITFDGDRIQCRSGAERYIGTGEAAKMRRRNRGWKGR